MDASNITGGPAQGHARGYEIRVLILLGLAYGFAYFDRMAMTFLAPFVQGDLELSNEEIGWLGSGLSATWALGAYLVGAWSDRIGRRKPFLLAALVLFSLCSVFSGIAWSFGSLLAARIVMGAAEGPFLPICLAILAAASAASRRGLNAGITQNVFGSIIGTALAPVVLVGVAQAYGWREAFFLAGVPGLVLAFLIWRFIDEPEQAPADQSGAPRPSLLPWHLLSERNIVLCSVISCFAVGSAVIGSIFMPLYLNGPLGIAPDTWSWMFVFVGFCPAVGAVLLGLLSDRIGRRVPVVIGGLLMAIPPLALLFADTGPAGLTIFMFIGWMGMGIFPLFMGVIPSETLGRARAATAMGLVVAIGELTGGVFGPPIAGRLADNFSLDVPMYLQMGLALAAGLTAIFLAETNPRFAAHREGAELA